MDRTTEERHNERWRKSKTDRTMKEYKAVGEKDYPIKELLQPNHVQSVDSQLHECTRVAVVKGWYSEAVPHTERFTVPDFDDSNASTFVYLAVHELYITGV